jgi:hypothetical protein
VYHLWPAVHIVLPDFSGRVEHSATILEIDSDPVGVCCLIAQQKSPAEAGLEPFGFEDRISCKPSGSSHMGRRLDARLGHRMVLQEPQLPLRAQLRPGRPSSGRRSNRWHDIRHRVRDGSQRRIRQRLERPNCPEFDYSPTAWPVSRPLTIRQQQQLELKR